MLQARVGQGSTESTVGGPDSWSVGAIRWFSSRKLAQRLRIESLQFLHDMKKIVIVSPAIGAVTCVSGLMFSLFLDLPVGSCIVLVSALIFALAVILSPKRKRKEVKQ